MGRGFCEALTSFGAAKTISCQSTLKAHLAGISGGSSLQACNSRHSGDAPPHNSHAMSPYHACRACGGQTPGVICHRTCRRSHRPDLGCAGLHMGFHAHGDAGARTPGHPAHGHSSRHVPSNQQLKAAGPRQLQQMQVQHALRR